MNGTGTKPWSLLTSAGILWLALTASSATAQASILSFTFDQSVVSLYYGTSITFTGTLSVTGTGDAFIGGDAFPELEGFIPYSSDPKDVSVDDTSFLLLTPFCMNPAETTTNPDCNGSAPSGIPGVDLVTVTAGSEATPGWYIGQLAIVYGSSLTDTSQQTSPVEFDVYVYTPEPRSFWLLALGLVLLVWRWAGH
jgi:hypothetical protein